MRVSLVKRGVHVHDRGWLCPGYSGSVGEPPRTRRVYLRIGETQEAAIEAAAPRLGLDLIKVRLLHSVGRSTRETRRRGVREGSVFTNAGAMAAGVGSEVPWNYRRASTVSFRAPLDPSTTIRR